MNRKLVTLAATIFVIAFTAVPLGEAQSQEEPQEAAQQQCVIQHESKWSLNGLSADSSGMFRTRIYDNLTGLTDFISITNNLLALNGGGGPVDVYVLRKDTGGGAFTYLATMGNGGGYFIADPNVTAIELRARVQPGRCRPICFCEAGELLARTSHGFDRV